MLKHSSAYKHNYQPTPLPRGTGVSKNKTAIMKASHITALKMTAHALLVLAGYVAILALVSENAAWWLRLLSLAAVWVFVKIGRAISPELYEESNNQ